MVSLALRIAVTIALAGLPLCANESDGISLTIRFATGSNQFKVGQVIPIKLTFQASTPNQYSFNTASYDRSGRSDMERFEVAPQGRDPLYSYYHELLGGFVFGGLYSILLLGKEPQVLQRSLNEWVALDNPGHYTLRVISSRVGSPQNTLKQPNRLASNILEFDVIRADASWQQQTLSRAVASLDDPAASQGDKAAAEETLRFLDSPKSVRELTRQLTKPGNGGKWNFTAGLLGAQSGFGSERVGSSLHSA